MSPNTRFTPWDIAVLISSAVYLLSAEILIVTMLRLMCCEVRKHYKNNIHTTEHTKCNVKWAFWTSLFTIMMCLSYGIYFMYAFLKYHGTNNTHYKSLTGHLPMVPEVISASFRSVAMFLFLSHGLWKLSKKYTQQHQSRRESCIVHFLSVLAIVSSILSLSGTFLDKNHWYYYTNSVAYILATVIIFATGILFQRRLNTFTNNNNNRNRNNEEASRTRQNIENPNQVSRSSAKSKPALDEREERKINDLSKQVTLSLIQSVVMTVDFLIQGGMYIYYSGSQNVNHWIALPAQTISFCIVIVLVNLCIWLSLEFTSHWYTKYFIHCHNCLKKNMRNTVMTFGTPILNGHDRDDSDDRDARGSFDNSGTAITQFGIKNTYAYDDKNNTLSGQYIADDQSDDHGDRQNQSLQSSVATIPIDRMSDRHAESD